MDNPHGVTAAQVGAVSSSGLASHAADPSVHHEKTTSFMDLIDQATDAQIPVDITRDSELAAELAGKADTGHTHDERYYTKDEVSDLIIALSDRIAYLESLLQNVTKDGDDITFSGVNVHIVNGSGTTEGTTDGLGNLIVGYNELRGSGEDVRTGTHNIVVGSRNNYASYGGLVVGYTNDISGAYSSVSGGESNTASGDYSSVSGGRYNTASGEDSSVSGGEWNVASEFYSSVSGGHSNEASGYNSSVSGGHSNKASGSSSSVSGGLDNEASEFYSSISGGRYNTANGTFSSVSGGMYNRASGAYSFVGGGGSDNPLYGNEAFGNYSAVLGGIYNIAGDPDRIDHTIGEKSTVSGGDTNRATGTYASVSGGKTNTASGFAASVSGGRYNKALGDYSTVVGGGSDTDGFGNWASAHYSSILGGTRNFVGDPEGDYTLGMYSTISGGEDNALLSNYFSILGGTSLIPYDSSYRAATVVGSSGDVYYSFMTGGLINAH
jgi:hypothetical protein